MGWGRPLTRDDYLGYLRFLPAIVLGPVAKSVVGTGYWGYAAFIGGGIAGLFIGAFLALGIERLLPARPSPSASK